MTIVPIEEVEASFRKYLSLAKQEDVIVTRNGKAAGRITAMSEEDLEDYLLEHDPRFVAELQRRQAEFQRTGEGISIEQLCQRLGLPSLDEIRKSRNSSRTQGQTRKRKS